MKPLSGIKVLDFSTIFAGPHCGQLLADYGADVIKIEPVSGDDSRQWQPFHSGRPGSGTLFLVVNRNKRSMVVDLKHPEGIAVVRKLVSTSDVVLQNFSAGVMDRLGLGQSDLRAGNPRLIYCTISAFGEVGPMAHARGYDPALQAFSGMMQIPQEGGPPPSRINIPLIDFTTGQNAFAGILAAIIHRQATGEGSYLEVCLSDSAMALQAWGLQRAWAAENNGLANQASQSVSDNVPYEAFKASDGYLFVACGNNKLWQLFCTGIGRPELASDLAFATNVKRRQNYAALMVILRPLMASRPRAEWEQVMVAAGVPAAPVNTLPELAAHPQISASGIVQEYVSPEFGCIKTVARAVRFNGTVAAAGRPPPMLGEHTLDVLREAGYSDADAHALFAAGAIGIAMGTATKTAA